MIYHKNLLDVAVHECMRLDLDVSDCMKSENVRIFFQSLVLTNWEQDGRKPWSSMQTLCAVVRLCVLEDGWRDRAASREQGTFDCTKPEFRELNEIKMKSETQRF